MNTGDTYFLVLYIINVFQPVSREDMLAEVTKTATIQNDAPNRQIVLDALKKLIRGQLVIEERGLLSSTILGTQRAAKLGLRRSRDKNRLFFLKNLLRHEYNGRR